MSTNHTPNLNLPQWEGSDRILREEFNDAMAKIDAAMPKFVFGTYTGTYINTGYSPDTPQHIELGFRPKIVFIYPNEIMPSSGNHCAILFDTEGGKSQSGASIDDTGFTFSARTNFAYRNDVSCAYCNPYRYIAIRM